MIDMDAISQRIKEFREYTQLSITDFSKQCGIEEDKMRKLENGRLKAKLIDVVSISRAFNVSTDYLLGIDKAPHPIIHTNEEHALWSKLESLTPDEMEQLIKAFEEEGIADYEE